MSQRIIAIDDSDIAQEFIRATLSDIGFDDVTGYMSPHEALDAISVGDTAADLILLDIMMPEMDGIELCARIRGLDAWTDVPIIMLTSRKDVDSLSQAFMAGANDYVTKPFDRIELQARMRSCLRLKSELDRRRAIETRNRRQPDIQIASASSIRIGNLVGSRAGLNADLLSLQREAEQRLGIIAFRVDEVPGWTDAAAPQRTQIVQQIAEIVGEVSISASDCFVHWDEGLFCLASLDASTDEMEAQASRFIAAVEAAAISVQDNWQTYQVSISAAIASPNSDPVASSLANAIRAVEDASRTGRGTVVHVSPDTRKLAEQ